MSDEEQRVSLVDGWLQPIDGEGGPCGPDLEYDNSVLALHQAAAGKPETQFDAGSPPDWRAVLAQSAELLSRTRDLRIAVLWVRAAVHMQGFVAVPEGLRLLHGLLANFWDHLHPLLDADDGNSAYARMNALGPLREIDGLLGDLRQSLLVQQRGVGELRVRSIEVAASLIAPKSDETVFTKDQIAQMLAAAVAQDPALRDVPSRAENQLKALTSLLGEHSQDDPPDLQPLNAMLHMVAEVMPRPALADEAAGAESTGEGGASGAAPAAGRLTGQVHSRDDALRAIDMVCEYLERTEPTSPAPLLLRRARRMINRNFLQLMKELAPDALAEVARVMGVDPDTVSLDSPS